MSGAPDTSFALIDDFSLDPDADDLRWAIVRKDTIEGFETSDKFIRQNNGDFHSKVWYSSPSCTSITTAELLGQPRPR